MQAVSVRGLSIGSGRPKIVVPLTGSTPSRLLAQAGALAASPAQMAEWRLDGMEQGDDPAVLLRTGAQLRSALGELPLLATFRRAAEGGARELSPGAYATVIETAALGGAVDLVDIELSAGEDFVRRELDFCHAHGVKVILSYHNFQCTPGIGELLQRLRLMEALGGDIAKIAVMPRSPGDVLTLLDVTQEYAAVADCPIVTVSMGTLGALSRISGEVFGSALTFAALDGASAPGQLPAQEMARLLELLSPNG